ncbi:hypothetical protein [Duganella violaceipulchra]|uniref:Uncharacterized protein n=1 Tax=Duganella violaceipulchra TaxID=2849652 RepID=A0ABT1GS30_9BURK|nr:hypothetical protein [Duganella violaceicalia]MCP2010328.1 hypothetical protein [Duganella violaceicalia]
MKALQPPGGPPCPAMTAVPVPGVLDAPALMEIVVTAIVRDMLT